MVASTGRPGSQQGDHSLNRATVKDRPFSGTAGAELTDSCHWKNDRNLSRATVKDRPFSGTAGAKLTDSCH